MHQVEFPVGRAALSLIGSAWNGAGIPWRKSGKMTRLRHLLAAAFVCAAIGIGLPSKPVHAGQPNPAPAVPAAFRPGDVQLGQFETGECGGQFTTEINALNKAGIEQQHIGLDFTAAGVIAQGIAALIGFTQPLIPGMATEGAGLALSALGLIDQANGAALTQTAAGLPNCDTRYRGTQTVQKGGVDVTGASIFQNEAGAPANAVTVGVIGNVSVGGDATQGTVTATNLTATNAITADTVSTATLSTTAGATIGGGLNVAGATILNGATQVNNTLTVTGLTSTNGIANIGNISTTTLSTIAGATIGGVLNVAGPTTLNGATQINSTLAVTGLTSTHGIANTGTVNTTTLSTTAGATIGTTLSVGGDATIGGALRVGNGITIGGSTPGMSGNGARVTVDGTNASLVNSTGHGVAVGESQTLITGGTSSTALQLDDSGARFSNVQTGGPARVTGVADGVGPYDAVNYGQLNALDKRTSTGISSVTAMANIPSLDNGKTVALGVGIGTYNGHTSLAVGGNYRVSTNVVLRASAGYSTTSGAKPAAGIGASFGW